MKTYPERRTIRLQGYDYSNHWWYFVTICTHERECMLGNIKNGQMFLNEWIPTGASRRAPTLGFIVGLFKSETAKQIRKIKFNNIFFKVWQRNYYEHIIRNEKELFAIRQYIVSNPQNWDKDKNNPQNIVK